MPGERLEVQDIFRARGPAWRRTNAGHLSLSQLKVMAAIERCRTAALGGHVAACQDCGHIHVAYNSCRNRHCPKCQGAAAKDYATVRSKSRANKINALRPLVHSPFRPELSIELTKM